MAFWKRRQAPLQDEAVANDEAVVRISEWVPVMNAPLAWETLVTERADAYAAAGPQRVSAAAPPPPDV